jgi:zinc/manganese transport system permease protein
VILLRGGERRRTLRQGLRAMLAAISVVGLLAGGWLAFNPRADQPLLDAAESCPAANPQLLSQPRRTRGLRLGGRGRARVQGESARMNDVERARRWQGGDLPDDEVRRLSSYVKSFQEMRKGEQFVQREIRNKARERQRWAIGFRCCCCRSDCCA